MLSLIALSLINADINKEFVLNNIFIVDLGLKEFKFMN